MTARLSKHDQDKLLMSAIYAIDQILLQWSPIFDGDNAARTKQHIAGNAAAIRFHQLLGADALTRYRAALRNDVENGNG